MSTFGEKLKAERERRNTPLQDVAARTRIGIRYLEALEHDNFDELPGPRGFGKLYIRAYAEMLGFDPAPLIQEYDEVVHRRLCEAGEGESAPTRPRLRRVRYVPPPRPASEGGASTTDPDELPDDADLPELDDLADLDEASPEPTMTRVPGEPAARRSRLIGAAVGTLLLVVALGVLLRDPGTADDASVTDEAAVSAPQVVAIEPAPETAAPIDAVTQPDDPAVVEAPEPDPKPVIVTKPEPASARAGGSALSVTSAGVGSGVVNLRLTGEATSFREGDVVSFLTRVRGGVAGQRIRHVWICEGRVIQSIPLTLGGANWRTFTNKTVLGTGAWAVEARDDEGTVLARSEFEVRRSRR